MIKYLYLILILLASVPLLGSDLPEENLIIPRLGNKIDPEEKEYFRLFPQIKEFVSAEIVRNNPEDYLIKVLFRKSGRKDTVRFNLSDDEYSRLIYAVENFEYLHAPGDSREKIDLDFGGLIDTVIKPEFRYYSDDRGEIVLKSVAGENITGELLWADRSIMIIAEDFIEFDWRETNKNIRVFHYSEISELQLPQLVDVNGNLQVYNNLEEELRNRSRFINKIGNKDIPPPPEFYNAIRQKNLFYAKAEVVETIHPENKIRDFDYNYHIAAEYAPYTFMFDQEVIYLLLRNTTNDIFRGTRIISGFYFESMNNYAPGLQLERTISENLLLGFSFTLYNSGKIGFPIFHVESSGRSYSLALAYLPYLRKPMPLSFLDRIQLKYFAGILITDYQRKFFINYSSVTIPEDRKNELEFDNILLGAYLGMELEYYIFSNLSLNSKFHVMIHPPFTYDGFLYQTGTDRYIEIPETKLYYVGLGIKFGLGFHF